MKRDKNKFLLFSKLLIGFVFILILILYLVLLTQKLDLNISIFITIIFLYIVNVLISSFIFVSKRTKESKISWLMFIIFFPVFGPIIYLILGNKNKYETLEKKEYDKKREELGFSNIENIENYNFHPLMKQFSKISNRNIISSNIVFFDKGYEAYNQLFEDLKNAKKYIFIEMYIIKESENYEELFNILKDKSKEGIEIKILIDDFGKWSIKEDEIKNLKKIKNIEILEFKKVTFPFMKLSHTYRMHRKFILIDGLIVHSGGVNISDEYSSYDKKYGFWADLNYRICSNEVSMDYLSIFSIDWISFGNKKNIDIEKYKVINNVDVDFVNDSNIITIEDGPNTSDNTIYSIINKAISNSKNKLDIVTPYFIPNKELLEMLKSIILSGVEVNFYIPGKPDKKFVYLA